MCPEVQMRVGLLPGGRFRSPWQRPPAMERRAMTGADPKGAVDLDEI